MPLEQTHYCSIHDCYSRYQGWRTTTYQGQQYFFSNCGKTYLSAGGEKNDHLALKVRLDEAQQNVQLFVQLTYHVVLNQLSRGGALVLAGSHRHVLDITLQVGAQYDIH